MAMGFIAEGFRMVFMDRRYWRYILVPWMWSTLIFLAVVVIGYFALVPWIQGALEARLGTESGLSGIAKTLVSLTYVVVWFFLAGFVFLLITSITSSFLWDELSQRVEEQITGQPGRKSTLPTGRIVSDSVSRGLFAIFIAILSLFCGWVIPFIAPVILAGWLGVLDYTSPAFLRYDRTVGQQWPVATKMKGWFGFQVASGLLSLLPFVNVFMLPALVAGGTSMAVRSGVLGSGGESRVES
ncbi:MAG: EI24 domain-containing protein [Chlorobia bacterium]|nr:EI24 domain-containing protein [Fimbriimonadaceae bacterium]